MHDFRTVLSLNPSPTRISHSDTIFTVGSCFAENLGQLLTENKFDIAVNPFGTCYNPISIHQLLTYASKNEMPGPGSYGTLNDTYFNYDFHSSFSSLDQTSLKNNIEKTINSCHQRIKKASVVIITYGTSWVYHRKADDIIVSNCHKVPSNNFSKHLLTQKKIIDSFAQIHDCLLENNPHIKIILTISPVRHIKDTLELNAVSKSILRLSCHTLTEAFSNVEYFPAYEIVMDDLRDYRFYNADLIHPSAEAIDYIWELFRARYFSTETNQVVEKWGNIAKSLQHKPFLPKSLAHQKFLQQLLSQLEEVRTQVNVDKEIDLVKKQLTP